MEAGKSVCVWFVYDGGADHVSHVLCVSVYVVL